jgi:DNA-binding MarR family transcriptional regulator
MTDELLRLQNAQIAAVLTYTAAVARRMDLGLSEIAALEHLQGAGELTPGALGARLSLSSGAITALVDRLERAGYVERHAHPRDRRSSILRPASAGTERALVHLAPLAADLREIADSLSDEEREVIGRYVDAVTAAIMRHGHEEGHAHDP